jgi:hypothetical protein
MHPIWQIFIQQLRHIQLQNIKNHTTDKFNNTKNNFSLIYLYIVEIFILRNKKNIFYESNYKITLNQ